MGSIINFLKKPRLGIMSIAIISSFILIPNIAIARNYPMVCRVGGSMRLILSPNVRTGDTRFELRFRKARRGYHFNRNNLAPGECTWMTRSINSREPSLMAWDLDARAYSSTPVTGYGSSQIGAVGDGGSDEELAINFLQAIKGRVIENSRIQNYEFFVVNVHNTNRGYFQIISIQAGV